MSNAFRRSRAKELNTLNQILNSSSTCITAHVLNEAATQCGHQKPNGKDSWGYDLVGLQFQIDKPQGTLPIDVAKTLIVEVSLIIEGVCVDNIPDVFNKLIMDITIFDQSAQNQKICTWHYDRHIEGGEEPMHCHPLYHFQHGGKGMQTIAESLGQVLLLEPPRIPFPPMEAILAVDFVLSNFAGEDWQKLREGPEYRNCIGEAQKRYWKPYIDSLWSFWQPGTRNQRSDVVRFWPNLIPLN